MLAEHLRDFLNTSQHVDVFLKKGVIPLQVITSYEMYSYYQERYKGNRRLKTGAIEETCKKFKCSKHSVYRVIKLMEN